VKNMTIMAALAALLLAACSKGPPPPDIPADGKIHVLAQKGRFRIEPETLFCGADGYVDKSFNKLGWTYFGLSGEPLVDALKKVNQSDYLGGSGRQRMADQSSCPDDGKNIIIEGTAGLNTSGDPYALVLNARQGPASAPGAVVRVAVARTAPYSCFDDCGFGYNPKPTASMFTTEVKMRSSLEHDSDAMSKQLIVSIFNGDPK
jgi:hypothetical protein